MQPEHIAIDMERLTEEASHASGDTDIVSTPSVSSPVDTMVLESVTSGSSTPENTYNNVGIYG